MAHPKHQDRLEGFQKDYILAWEASGQPDEGAVFDTFFHALDGKQPQPQLHALWTFIRCSLAKNVPLNWIGECRPKSQREKLAEAAMDSIPLMNEMPPVTAACLRALIEKIYHPKPE